MIIVKLNCVVNMIFYFGIIQQITRLGKASKKGTNLGHCPKFGYPLPPSELGTSLSEILLTVFFKFVELGLTDQFSSILVSKHLRRLGHSIWGVGPPPPLLGQCPKFVTFFFKPSLTSCVLKTLYIIACFINTYLA